jgi:adsorption protein A
MAAGGLRWKPIGSQNINLAVEEQTPLDHVAGNQTQAMLRASASFLNSGNYSDDWHPTGPGWIAQNLYLDAAHYMTSGLTSLTSDYRISYHDKIEIGQTIEPYTHLQLNTLNNQVNHDLRAGLGVRWNCWSGNTQYNAYPSKVYIGLEAQHAFTTYLNEKNVIFLSLGGRW